MKHPEKACSGDGSASGRRVAKRALRFYQAVATVVFTTLLAFLGLNLALEAAFSKRRPSAEGAANPAARYGAIAREQYPELTEEQYERMTREFWHRDSFVYEPFVQFRKREAVGEFVNVSPEGFRVGSEQGPWPPDPANYNVFVFGGSTTFNTGVRDDQTIVAELQTLMADGSGRPVRTYNFGSGYHFSTQERVLFEWLLLRGYVPDLAVFVDGLNDFFNQTGEPQFSGFLARTIDHWWAPSVEPGFLDWTNSLYLVKLLDRVTRGADDPEAAAKPRPRPPLAKASIGEQVSRYERNKRMAEAVGASMGVETVWVWQPVPTYRFDTAYHPFLRKGFGPHARSAEGYERMRTKWEAGEMGHNFLWLADMQEGEQEVLYVDLVHYNAKMSQRIAQEIDARLRARALGPYRRETSPNASPETYSR